MKAFFMLVHSRRPVMVEIESQTATGKKIKKKIKHPGKYEIEEKVYISTNTKKILEACFAFDIETGRVLKSSFDEFKTDELLNRCVEQYAEYIEKFKKNNQ